MHAHDTRSNRFAPGSARALTFSVTVLLFGACTVTEPEPEPMRDAGPNTDVPVLPGEDAPIDVVRLSPARVEVQPAALLLTSVLDEVVEQTFEVYFVDERGARMLLDPAEVDFALDDPRIGIIDPSGHFTSGARSSGAAQLTVHARTRTVNVPIEIRRSVVVLAGGATEADGALFGTLVTDPATEAGVVYPLDGVVMPQDVAPLDVQWTRGAVGDVFRIRFTSAHTNLVALVRERTPLRNGWVIDASLFRLIAQADLNENIELHVDRYDSAAGRAIEGPPRTLRFVPGVLGGNVYYWDASSSGLRRITHGTGIAEVVDTGGRCVGCHSISPDGRTMAVRYDGGSGVGGLRDIETGVTRESVSWYFSSFSPAGDRLIVDTAAMSLELLDVASGAVIAAASDTLPRSRSANPAWAPSGEFVAFVANIDVNYRPGFDSYQDGDLALLPVTGDTFGTPSVIVDAATISSPTLAPYRCVNQPTWAPDSSMIVFAAGPYSNTSWANALYAVRIDGGTASSPSRLDAAMGGPARIYEDVDRGGCTFPPTTAACCHDVYHGAFSADDGVCVMTETDLDGSPRFSPFYQGGYFWLVFSSRRPYGNELVGTPRAHGVGRPQSVSQLWIAAIDPSGEFDPSFAPYWLAGQDPSVSNIDAQWAPNLCASTGDACSVDGECCSGVCSAAGICETPPPDRCHDPGETCSEASDCCGDLLCTGRLCSYPLM